jgi:hypothetical protein
MISAPRQLTKTRLDADDPTVAERFRALDEARRRRLACSMVRDAIAEHPVTLPPTILGLLGTAGVATPAQLADLDRRAASAGGPPAEDDFRRARLVAAARYALSPQPRAPEEAVHEALHARASLARALDALRNRLD